MTPILTRPGYAINENGDVFSIKKDVKRLSQRLNRTGYPVVNLFVNGKKQLVTVHTLVLEAFRGTRPSNQYASHLDGDRRNCKLSNLVWEPQSKNLLRKKDHGTFYVASRKLTEHQVSEIKTQLGVISMEKLAKKYNVSPSCIKRIKNNETWKSVKVLVMPMREDV